MPGLRLLDKWAVLIGGGVNHRIGLYDMVMIKNNHISAAGSVNAAVHRTLVRTFHPFLCTWRSRCQTHQVSADAVLPSFVSLNPLRSRKTGSGGTCLCSLGALG